MSIEIWNQGMVTVAKQLAGGLNPILFTRSTVGGRLESGCEAASTFWVHSVFRVHLAGPLASMLFDPNVSPDKSWERNFQATIRLLWTVEQISQKNRLEFWFTKDELAAQTHPIVDIMRDFRLNPGKKWGAFLSYHAHELEQWLLQNKNRLAQNLNNIPREVGTFKYDTMFGWCKK